MKRVPSPDPAPQPDTPYRLPARSRQAAINAAAVAATGEVVQNLEGDLAIGGNLRTYCQSAAYRDQNREKNSAYFAEHNLASLSDLPAGRRGEEKQSRVRANYSSGSGLGARTTEPARAKPAAGRQAPSAPLEMRPDPVRAIVLKNKQANPCRFTTSVAEERVK